MDRKSAITRQAIRVGGFAAPSIKGELKFNDISLGGPLPVGNLTFSLAGGLLLNGIQLGYSATQRIGRKIVMKSCLVRYTLNLAPTTTGGCQVRTLVVYDKQANATAPAVTDILLTDQFNSPNNLSNRDRFVTIIDDISEPICTQGNNIACKTLYKKFDLETMYNDKSLGTVADIATGSLYLFYATSGQLVTTAGAYNAIVRVRYDDK